MGEKNEKDLLIEEIKKYSYPFLGDELESKIVKFSNDKNFFLDIVKINAIL